MHQKRKKPEGTHGHGECGREGVEVGEGIGGINGDGKIQYNKINLKKHLKAK